MYQNFYIYGFEKLEVCQKARRLRVEIKLLSKSFPTDEKFDLTSQIRRSSSSVATNLAEGSGRASSMDQAHFTTISYSSALETIDHLNYACGMKYIDSGILYTFRLKLDEILKNLNALYKFQKRRKLHLKNMWQPIQFDYEFFQFYN
ncbi:four helix bundle protein [Algoriphagus halophytocola]|uniref:Four helix bundle protein n=1 Tax=Algoriphagus halophytocola TaxID=2991499 RepID=A0ABY6MNB6_9BACT|nr:four helix bundle protein [Algoriphagus sp. TR-M5]UZD23887.1 four helix bundle protein [Algoriphagus sp. TR-M5]